MPWVEPVSAVITAAELASKLAESSAFIKKHAKRIAYQIKHGRVVIPVFGAGGVGKSTAGKLLHGANPLDLATPYDESWDPETIQLKGDIPGQILVAPGQEPRVAKHWAALAENVITGKAFGVINVVAYGYHSFGLQSYKEHNLYKPGMTVSDFAAAYTAAHRTVEQEMLEALLTDLAAATRPLWIITLVNKQDLWWSDRETVRRHYEGQYAQRIEKFGSTIGVKHFQHDMLPVSLVLGNLMTGAGEIVAPTSAGYDFAHHARYSKTMFEKLNNRVRLGRSK